MNDKLSKIDKPIIFKLVKKNVAPATEGRYYPLTKRIPSEDEIYDASTGTTKHIRYSVREESIFRTEQPSNVILTDIIFTNGTLRVHESNPTLLKYLRTCNYNSDNPHRVRGKRAEFYEYNPEKIAAENIRKEEQEIDAKHKALHMPFEELIGVARAMKVNVNRSAQEVRHDMVQLAKKNPSGFLDALDSPHVQRKVEVLQAIELGILQNEHRGMFMKTVGGNMEQVHITPVGEDAVEAFTHWTLSTKEGEELFGEVQKKRNMMLD